jgi:hypothetical protein
MLTACRAGARPGPELLHASPLEQTLTSESKLRHLGRPIVQPRTLPTDVTDILVGLNPRRAQAILAQAGLGERSGLRLFLP